MDNWEIKRGRNSGQTLKESHMEGLGSGGRGGKHPEKEDAEKRRASLASVAGNRERVHHFPRPRREKKMGHVTDQDVTWN